MEEAHSDTLSMVLAMPVVQAWTSASSVRMVVKMIDP
jgi:hypothetical protein